MPSELTEHVASILRHAAEEEMIQIAATFEDLAPQVREKNKWATLSQLFACVEEYIPERPAGFFDPRTELLNLVKFAEKHLRCKISGYKGVSIPAALDIWIGDRELSHPLTRSEIWLYGWILATACDSVCAVAHDTRVERAWAIVNAEWV